MNFLLSLLLLMPVLAHAHFSLSAGEESTPSLESLFQDVNQALPNSIKLGINKNIEVFFKELSHKDGPVWGEVRGNLFAKKSIHQINLNIRLLENIQTKESYDLAKATLLHELTHIFDFQNLLLGPERELQLTKKKFTISDSPLFLSLSNWKKKGLLRKHYRQTNKFQGRRVDLYEDHSPQETLAVNMEHFLLDPEFGCRKPSLYNYLSKALDHRPFPDFECHNEYQLAPSVSLEGVTGAERRLDPTRLFEVHYLFAGQGKNIMSRWGHAMIRLVMCAPHRKQIDEKCLQDRAHHLVLSFRADITNFSIDYLKGLTGAYASKMFVLPMSEVIKEYTVGELRDLYSIPLKMDKLQKDLMISQVLEHYWGYESKYYFVSNNCADETLNLIRNVYLNDLKMLKMDVLTPLSLKNKLTKLGLADMSVFQNKDEAKKAGYFFEGLNAKLERVFSELSDSQIIEVPTQHIEKFLNRSTLEERKILAQGQIDKSILGKLLFIEETILNRKLISTQKEMASHLSRNEHHDSPDELISLYQEIQSIRSKKILRLSSGYGLPLKSDHVFATTDSPQDEEQLIELQQKFSQEIDRIFLKQRKEIFEISLHKQQLFNQLVGK